MSDEGDVCHMIPDKSKTIVKEILGVSPEQLSFLTDKGILNVNIDRNMRCVGERDIQKLEYRFYDENNTTIAFHKSKILPAILSAKSYRDFNDLNRMITKCGHSTFDAS